MKTKGYYTNIIAKNYCGGVVWEGHETKCVKTHYDYAYQCDDCCGKDIGEYYGKPFDELKKEMECITELLYKNAEKYNIQRRAASRASSCLYQHQVYDIKTADYNNFLNLRGIGKNIYEILRICLRPDWPMFDTITKNGTLKEQVEYWKAKAFKLQKELDLK